MDKDSGGEGEKKKEGKLWRSCFSRSCSAEVLGPQPNTERRQKHGAHSALNPLIIPVDQEFNLGSGVEMGQSPVGPVV